MSCVVGFVSGQVVTLGSLLCAQVLRKYGSRQLFHLFNETFNHLPVCAVVDDAAIVLHGGLFRFDGIEVAHLANLPRTDLDLASSSRDMGLLADALWADPQPEPGRALSHRAAGGGVITFGPDVTRRFLQRNGVALLVRSHQLPQGGRGYEVLHDGALVTVFSASNYEGIAGNMGAVLIFDTPHNRSFKEYMAPPLHSLVGALQQVPPVCSRPLPHCLWHTPPPPSAAPFELRGTPPRRGLALCIEEYCCVDP